jgi:hypothetical protein
MTNLAEALAKRQRRRSAHATDDSAARFVTDIFSE